MNRLERKFLIPIKQYYRTRDRWDLLFQRDSNSNALGFYPIVSQYLDTPQLDFYRQKVEGEFHQIKARLRCYSQSLFTEGITYLELKTKQGRKQRKFRRSVSSVPPNPSKLAQQLALLDEAIRIPPLDPSANVYYEREAFHYVEQGCSYRLNFDLNLHCAVPSVHNFSIENEQIFPILPPNTALLEIKSPNEFLPKILRRELHRIEASEQAFSKYVSAINVLNELSFVQGANQWNLANFSMPLR